MNKFPPFISGVFLLATLSSCRDDKPEKIVYDVKESIVRTELKPIKNPENLKTYHVDSAYEYEYRTGESGSYRYHYEVFGENTNGEKVTGEVDMQGKYGNGFLADSTEIDAEWIKNGVIQAKDANGNSYELKVEEQLKFEKQ